jgi:hypothetical protein
MQMAPQGAAAISAPINSKLSHPEDYTMETSSLKGLEFLVIIGAVAWFYVAQTRNLKRLKEEREAKADNPDKSDGSTNGKGSAQP